MGIFSVLIMMVTFTLCIMLRDQPGMAVLIGMTLIYISSIQEFLYYTFTAMAEVESQFVSYERCRLLTEIPQEAA